MLKASTMISMKNPHYLPPLARRLALVSFGLLSLLGCESAPKEPAPRENPPSNPATPVMAEPQRMQVAQVPISPDDPLKGKSSLAEATDGLGDEGKLTASIE